MAAITLSYRSNKDVAHLEVRLSFRIDGNNLNPRTGKEMPYSFYTRSNITVTKDFWKEFKKGTNFRDGHKSNLKKDLTDDIHNIKTFIIDRYSKTEKELINKAWLKNTVQDYYNPTKPEKKEVIPHSLLGYWKYYLNIRDNELSNTEKKKFKVTKAKLERYLKASCQKLEIKDINDNFKKDFIDYCESESYALSTTKKDLALIKRVCTHARIKKIETSPELDNLKAGLNNNEIQKKATPKIYLSFDELNEIKKVKDLPDYLDNVRDWLIISCYTGQRISDFMRFNKSMLRKEKTVTFLDITQVKTNKEVTIPVLPEVLSILDKRNGNFPHPISEQRYNEWVKLVCQKAEINKKIKGRLAKNINPDPKGETIIRNVLGTYPKWKLIGSHVGRRSFATNYYGKIPTTYIKDITAHSTESQLLSYIGKSSNDTAYEAYELLMNVKK